MATGFLFSSGSDSSDMCLFSLACSSMLDADWLLIELDVVDDVTADDDDVTVGACGVVGVIRVEVAAAVAI